MEFLEMTAFTPWESVAGGVLIGLAAVWLMLANGRIAGISGFVNRLLPPYSDAAWLERLAFVGGLLIAPLLFIAGGGSIVQTVPDNMILLLVAGVLVGFGTTIGNGCTSGHGVCGLALLSWRSVVATLVFMFSGMAVVFLTRHVL
jgi:uncharacterized membrane protein YedE/YeeE